MNADESIADPGSAAFDLTQTLVVRHDRRPFSFVLAALVLVFIFAIVGLFAWSVVGEHSWSDMEPIARFVTVGVGLFLLIWSFYAVRSYALILFGEERLIVTDDALINRVTVFGLTTQHRYLRAHIGPIAYLPYKKIGYGKNAKHRPSQICVSYMSRFKKMAVDVADAEGARIVAFLQEAGGFEITDEEGLES